MRESVSEKRRIGFDTRHNAPRTTHHAPLHHAPLHHAPLHHAPRTTHHCTTHRCSHTALGGCAWRARVARLLSAAVGRAAAAVGSGVVSAPEVAQDNKPQLHGQPQASGCVVARLGGLVVHGAVVAVRVGVSVGTTRTTTHPAPPRQKTTRCVHTAHTAAGVRLWCRGRSAWLCLCLYLCLCLCLCACACVCARGGLTWRSSSRRCCTRRVALTPIRTLRTRGGSSRQR